MLNIVYDYQIFSAQSYGGISRYFCELATILGKHDEIAPLIYAPIHINKYLRHCPKGLVWGEYVPLIPKLSRPRNWVNVALTSLYLRSVHRSSSPLIIHETYYSAVRLAPAKAKIVITVYDMIHEKFSSFFGRGNGFPAVKAAAIKRADHVICISESTRRDLLERLDILPEKVSVVHLASSLGFQHNTTYPKRGPEHDPYILFVGSRSGYKNFKSLLCAYARSIKLMSDFKILCFGGGPFLEEEKKLMQQLRISPENITQISGDDTVLAACYRCASVFIFPSLYEGFGFPLLEAMTCFCPVVCSNTSSFPEVAGEAAEYFSPKDIDGIVNALELVLYSTDRTKVLIEFGAQRCGQFSWDICAEKSANNYMTLI